MFSCVGSSGLLLYEVLKRRRQGLNDIDHTLCTTEHDLIDCFITHFPEVPSCEVPWPDRLPKLMRFLRGCWKEETSSCVWEGCESSRQNHMEYECVVLSST